MDRRKKDDRSIKFRVFNFILYFSFSLRGEKEVKSFKIERFNSELSDLPMAISLEIE